MIRKQAISVTLERANVTWLKARADATACRSVSELLDRLVTTARLGGHVAARRSVAGTIEIDPADPSLERADAEIRRLFKTSRKRGSLIKCDCRKIALRSPVMREPEAAVTDTHPLFSMPPAVRLWDGGLPRSSGVANVRSHFVRPGLGHLGMQPARASRQDQSAQ